MENRPQLYEDLKSVWSGWLVLHSGRQYIATGFGGGSPAPITFEAIHFYSLRHGITGEDFDEFAHLIRHLDGVFMDVQKSKEPTDGKKGKKGRGSGNRAASRKGLLK